MNALTLRHNCVYEFQSPGLNITVDLSIVVCKEIVVSKKICFQLASQSDSHRFSCQLVESHP